MIKLSVTFFFLFLIAFANCGKPCGYKCQQQPSGVGVCFCPKGQTLAKDGTSCKGIQLLINSFCVCVCVCVCF